tara:strand:+ start:1555 stop:3588 length:2034 start_codon:yes stop_codon:yes gene_type:complete
MQNYEYLLSPIDKIDGVGKKTANLFIKKKIFTIFDLLWHLPLSKIEKYEEVDIKKLQIGKKQNIKLTPIKYNFPRIRNLPNKVICENKNERLDCIFFNSYEGYIKKILPLNNEVLINGKIGFYKNKYQIVNPKIVEDNKESIIKDLNKYSLTEGVNLTRYNKILNKVLKNLPDLDEWLSEEISKKFDFVRWKESIIKMHDKNFDEIKNTNYLKRLIFDEIFAHFLLSSKIRNKIKKIKKKAKFFDEITEKKILNSLNFKLTDDQKKSIDTINKDLKSKHKMFRLLQGDVGSGKTIVSIISAINTINSGYQVAFMVPTEILAIQHYNFIKNNFGKFCNLEILTSKTENKKKQQIIELLNLNKINFIVGTHSLFQKKINFSKLGLIIIDEQHKFGVNQRKKLSEKGGDNCDVLVMSATPIPRTMMMTIYGDMDITLIKSKPKDRKPIKTYSKLESKIMDVVNFVKKEINNDNQIFWVCPLIEKSTKIDHQSTIERYKFLNKFFKDKISIIHGGMDKDEKNKVLNKFLNKKIDVLISTTVIEVGIDFPNANIIVIENANKYGLSQLHQLRGRVGRGTKDSFCILVFKSNLSQNAKKRITILKNSNDGFEISEEDMKIRGYGDILGFKQSGIKKFKLADPLIHKDLFELAENEIKKIEKNNYNFGKYNNLIKLYDKASIIN